MEMVVSNKFVATIAKRLVFSLQMHGGTPLTLLVRMTGTTTMVVHLWHDASMVAAILTRSLHVVAA